MAIDAPNVQYLWAKLIVEELLRSGAGHFFLAPGSRSTPLALAVARNRRARYLVHFDERGTAFAALGYGRATGKPAVWITTSGTAVANGLPAVVEAATDGVPLILLTADRPPELRETGANQTIDQAKIFGDYVRWQLDLPVPDPAIDPAFVLTTVDQAVYRSLRAPAGPVHLNCMFREPLVPSAELALPSSLEAWGSGETPYTTYSVSNVLPEPQDLRRLTGLLTESERTLLIAGRLPTVAEGRAVAELATRLGVPFLPDVGSQVRLGAGDYPGAVPYYDQVLLSKDFAQAHRPEVVVYFGSRGASKRLQQFVTQSRPRHLIVVRNSPARFDPDHRVTWHVEASVAALCEALTDYLPERIGRATEWTSSWVAASKKAGETLNRYFEEASELSEPLVARLISGLIPEGHGLFLGSSMPVRDMDRFGTAVGPEVRVAANRGASGIDGTAATAAGFALGLKKPVTLVLGDLALLHDLNSLALLRKLPVPVVVVVVNNDGGGIFSFLPQAGQDDVFEPLFGTPHGYTFEAAARMFGLEYHHPDTPEAFIEAYHAASSGDRPVLIEVTTDRAANYRLHCQLDALVR